MSSLRFEWDPAKNFANQRKHGISFEQASQVFRDPLYIAVKERIEAEGQRWQTFGLAEGLLLLMVAHIVSEVRAADGELVEVIRIISARRATREERRRYEDENG